MPQDVKDQVLNESISTSNVYFKWMCEQMLLHVLSCLFSWDIFFQVTLK